MSTTIKPTVGRVVWFYPAANRATAGFHAPTLNDPLAAIVAKVIGAHFVNLAVFDAHGYSHSMIDVPLIQEGEKAPVEGCYATWMPYQIGQAKKAEEKTKDTELVGRAEPDRHYLRAQAIEMALRTPGLANHDEVLKAAAAYQAHIEGEKAAPAGRDREQELEDLLRSACAIADRQGEGTAWERFANSIRDVGLNGITARTYRILPTDEE